MWMWWADLGSDVGFDRKILRQETNCLSQADQHIAPEPTRTEGRTDG